MSQQQGGMKRLRDIVVSALQQGRDLVHGIRPACDEDNGNIRELPDFGAELETGFARQIQIQQDQIWLQVRNLPGNGFILNFCKHGDLIQGIFQEIPDFPAKGSVVFYD